MSNRLIGGLPAIGIRPIIDGRRKGVRESLEDQTMNMAKAAAAFLSENLRYSSGESVKCVISDTCIGGVAENMACAEKFSKNGVEITLSVTPCWCYGSETMDMDRSHIKAVWGFNGTERPGAVYLAAVLAAHSQIGQPAFGIYGHDVQNADDTTIPADVREKLLRFGRAAIAAAAMRDKSYLSFGTVSMGIAGSMVNADFFREYLGMRNEYIDMCEITRRIEQEIYDKEEFERALAWFDANCNIGKDLNAVTDSPEKKRYNKEFSVKMTMIARDLMIGNPKLKENFAEEAMGHNAIAGGFQGQRQWTDYLPNGDFMEAILNSSFDWNGIREPFVFATENDSLNGAAMLFGHLLTNAAMMFSDIRSYWSPEALERVGYKPEGPAAAGFIHLINSGATTLDATGRMSKDGAPAMKPFWEIVPEEADACLKNTQWDYADLQYFRGGGYSSRFTTLGGMPCTMMRVNWIHGLGPALQLAEGYTVDIPENIAKTIDDRTNPTWPSTWFVPILTGAGPFKDVYSVMNNWGANHGAIGYGHFGADVITLASILRIPVCMHNVSADKIFRPSAWNAFGMDPEGSDYRACAAYGPLYR